MSLNLSQAQSPAVNSALFALMRNAGGTEAAPMAISHRAKQRLISRAVRATNAVLAVLGTPDNVHRYLMALIALSNGEVSFEASDADVGREVYADRRNSNTLKMWARRSRKAVVQWQHRTRWRIVTISPGGKVGKEYLTTQYELPLLKAIAKVARSRNMQSAAFDCLIELQDEKRKVSRDRFNNRPRTEGEAMMKRCQKAALTYAEKMCIEALNMQPMGTPRDLALTHVSKLAEAFTRELNTVMREFAHTGQTRAERTVNVRSKKSNAANAADN